MILPKTGLINLILSHFSYVPEKSIALFLSWKHPLCTYTTFVHQSSDVGYLGWLHNSATVHNATTSINMQETNVQCKILMEFLTHEFFLFFLIWFFLFAWMFIYVCFCFQNNLVTFNNKTRRLFRVPIVKKEVGICFSRTKRKVPGREENWKQKKCVSEANEGVNSYFGGN